MISERKAKAALKELNEKRLAFRKDVHSEFRKQVLTAITAAFAFIMALSWREPIEIGMKALVAWLGLPADGIYPKLFTAVVITIIGAVALVLIARWANREEKK